MRGQAADVAAAAARAWPFASRGTASSELNLVDIFEQNTNLARGGFGESLVNQSMVMILKVESVCYFGDPTHLKKMSFRCPLGNTGSMAHTPTEPASSRILQLLKLYFCS
jgi:hypothetical protein